MTLNQKLLITRKPVPHLVNISEIRGIKPWQLGLFSCWFTILHCPSKQRLQSEQVGQGNLSRQRAVITCQLLKFLGAFTHQPQGFFPKVCGNRSMKILSLPGRIVGKLSHGNWNSLPTQTEEAAWMGSGTSSQINKKISPVGHFRDISLPNYSRPLKTTRVSVVLPSLEKLG